MSPDRPNALSNLEYHVLLALAGSALYGYAIKTAVESESDGTLTPRAGSLYRVLARLMSWGLVEEVELADDEAAHPGLQRRYYALTDGGRSALAGASQMRRRAAALARRRLRLRERRP